MATHISPRTFITFLLLLWTSVCHAQFKVWRADTRTPEQLKKTGFLPRGLSGVHKVAPDISMWDHAQGAANGQSTDADGYVSTAAAQKTAADFLGTYFRGTGYIYTIAAMPNFIQVSGTLGQYSPYPNEHEYAALGGFRWEQVISWEFRQNGKKVASKSKTNPAYNTKRYKAGKPSNGQPSLAGFPAGHAAWKEATWAAFSTCPRTQRRSARDLQVERQASQCKAKTTFVAAAQAFMAKTCGTTKC